MADEKDRYGDKLREVEKGREDKFFAERDRELLDKLKTDDAPGATSAAAGGTMRCPKDGSALQQVKHLDVTVEECPRCEGIWLAKGELDEIGRRESAGWLSRYLGRPR